MSAKETPLQDGAIAPPSWKRDLLRGLLWALLILTAVLFYTGTASHFIYVDF